jgi:chromosome segregation ATPase
MTDIAKDQRHAPQGSSEWTHQRESENTHDETTNEPDEHNLGKVLAATIDRLCLVKEEVVALRRSLEQSEDLLREAGSQARELKHDLDKCHTKLRESEVKRQAGNIRFADIIERLRLQGAALESSRAEVAALQSKFSQATSVAVALRERIEAQVTSTQHHPATNVIDANHILRITESSTHSSSQALVDPSTCQTVLPQQISSVVDQESDVAKDPRAALRELIHRMSQLESESAQDITPTKPDGSHLEEKLATTTEQLRHLKEEIFVLRRNLSQSRDLMRSVVSQARDLAHELEKCQADLQESQEKRRTDNVRFIEVVERLRLRSATLQESKAEVDALQLKCSEATSLSAVRLDRINELEAQVTALKSMQTRSHPFTLIINADSPLRVPQGSRNSLSPHQIDQPAEIQEMIEYMRRPDPESAQHANPNDRDDRRLEEHLATTMGQLRLAEEEVLTLRRDLDQSRKMIWDMENRTNDVINSYRTKLSKTEDAGRALEDKFAETVENLRLRSAELEASMFEVEASQFKCSQFMFLSAALQERVDELDGEVKSLKGAWDYPAPTVAPSPSSFVTNTGMISPPSTKPCTLILDFEDISRIADLQTTDSTYITLSPSLP